MIYLTLLLEFLKIGLFTFGGAYGAIPLIRECIQKNGWMSEEMFSNMLAISESTPGPIMVNAATYIGNMQGGILGAAVATLGVVLPSFVVIVMISAFLNKYLQRKTVKAVMSGIKPCIIGMIAATGLSMLLLILLPRKTMSGNITADVTSVLIFDILIIISAVFYRMKKKTLSPILLICVSAGLGILLY